MPNNLENKTDGLAICDIDAFTYDCCGGNRLTLSWIIVVRVQEEKRTHEGPVGVG